MVAIDANVLVRFLTGDHPEQSARARALFEREEIFVATTVLLETEWVLRSAYGFGREAVVGALRAVAGLPRVRVEDPGRLAEALDRAAAGFDFADALHLATPQAAQGFATFDTRLVRAARRAGLAGVREP
jgi:predicted nucleic acid-binding protein